MASRIITLFGEELVPEQLQAVPRQAAADKPVQKNKQASAESPAMDLLADWTPTKQYYTIGEVAALFNIRTSHIRFWTNEFELTVRLTRKGDRLYTPAHITELRAIYHLVRERGFTIPGAKAKLKDKSQVSVETLDLKQTLLKLRNQLLLIRNKLV